MFERHLHVLENRGGSSFSAVADSKPVSLELTGLSSDEVIGNFVAKVLDFPVDSFGFTEEVFDGRLVGDVEVGSRP